MSKKPIILTALISVVATVMVCFAVYILTLPPAASVKFLLQSSYAGDVTDAQLSEGAVRGMVEALGDPYSAYFTEEEYAMFMEEMDANYVGIGIEVQMQDGNLVVSSTFPDTPAHEAGIMPGDILLRVNALEICEETYGEALSVLRTRKDDTPLTLTVLRGTETMTVSVSRATIHLDTVVYEKKEDIAYIRIRSFDSPTAGEMAAAIEQAEKTNARGLVIDVRDNPGGYLTTVADIADMLLPRCTIVYTENKDGKREALYESDETFNALPLVLLINENSASASEVLAGALKDNGRATLVGQKTYGKGSVQNLFKLKEGGIKLTVAHYYTSGGYIIDGNGIVPHYVVENRSPKGVDLQLEKAMELLLSPEADM